MNPTNPPTMSKGEYRQFDNPEDKAFYAAYLNTAKQNIFIILRDLSERLGLEFRDNDDKMLSAMFWSKLSVNDEEFSQRIIDHLHHHFRFLKSVTLNYARFRTDNLLATALPEDYHFVLKKWINQLIAYRNYYTHVAHDPICMDPQVIYDMRGLYYAEWKEFKKQKNLTDTDVAHLHGLDKKGHEKPGFLYAFRNDKGLTEKGLLYFTCLWLEKRSGQELLKKHYGFKDSRERSQKATLEKFTRWSAYVPKPKITSDHSTQSLFLDMVNELQRCPKALFDQLQKTHQQIFERAAEDETEELDGYENKPILLRKQNRFFYFALRYLDRSFEHLKFHIDLGNACFNSYDQRIAEKDWKRQWMHRITGFGNLTDFTNRVPESWKHLQAKPGEQATRKTYITETTPHYHFDPASEVMTIGMKWVEHYDPAAAWPLVKTDINGEILKPKNEAPDFWLSLYELPAMVFYQWLHLTAPTRVHLTAEAIIKQHQKNIGLFFSELKTLAHANSIRREELDTLLAKHHLEIGWVPKPIIKCILDQSQPTSHMKATNRLKEMMRENSELLDRLSRRKEHHQARTSSKDYLPMKSGHMADFLARDMIQLQPAINQDQGKANSTEFQVLQSQLAFFGRYRDQLQETFALCNLTATSNPHPFLHKVEERKCRGIFEYYQSYLQERGRFLQECAESPNPEQLHFLSIKPQRDLDKIIEGQLSAVMNLPRGLFKQPIINALKSKETTRPLAIKLQAMNRCNVAYIIQSYFHEIQQDQSQPYYNYPREYKLLNKLYDPRPNPLKGKPPHLSYSPQQLTQLQEDIALRLKISIEKDITKNKRKGAERIKEKWHKLFKVFTENEKQIRLYQNGDQVLWLTAQQLYQNLEEDSAKHQTPLTMEGDFLLGEITPETQKGILNMTVRVSVPIKTRSGHSKQIINPTLKIKNYGNFRALLKDRRVAGMLSFVSADEIAESAIRRELEWFEQVRVPILQHIHVLEKVVIEKYNLQKNKNGYISHDEILGYVPGLSKQMKNLLNEFRNMVCHSQYPELEVFKGLIAGADFNDLQHYKKENPAIKEKSIASQLLKLANHNYHETIQAVKKA